MAWLLDQEIQKLMLEAEARTMEIIGQNKTALINLAEKLLREETLDKEAASKIIEESLHSRDLSQPDDVAPSNP
jgi:cell division protease FtsH